MENQNRLPTSTIKSQSPLIIAGIIIVILSSTVAYLLGQKSQILPVPTQNNQILQPSLTSAPTNAPTQLSTQTNNWQLYNKLAEITFEYPQDWKELIPCKFGDYCVSSRDAKEQIINETAEGGGSLVVSQGGVFGLRMADTNGQEPITEKSDITQFCSPGGGAIITLCEKMPINRSLYMGVKRIWGNPEDSTTYTVITKNKRYEISLYYPSPLTASVEDKKVKETLTFIFSTLKIND